MPWITELREIAEKAEAARRHTHPTYEPPWIRKRRDRVLAEAKIDGDYWKSAVGGITGAVDRHRVARIPMREVYLQLNIPPSYVRSVSHRICALMRSYGWARRRIGHGLRLWVWERNHPLQEGR